jgi:acyl-CoA reductase-like NAD-dependent aldehyde dehydrogenase
LWPVLPAGKGSVCGDAITAHPHIDKVAFTGSTSIGKMIMEGGLSRGGGCIPCTLCTA